LRFRQLPGDLVDYRPAEPLLVVLDADVCFEHDRSRRPAGFAGCVVISGRRIWLERAPAKARPISMAKSATAVASRVP
jgi:hypothetical protein